MLVLRNRNPHDDGHPALNHQISVKVGTAEIVSGSGVSYLYKKVNSGCSYVGKVSARSNQNDNSGSNIVDNRGINLPNKLVIGVPRNRTIRSPSTVIGW